MSPLLTREVLDVMLAGLRQHDPAAAVPITQTCHPDAGVEAVYADAGIVRLVCHTCQRECARLLLLAGTLPGVGTQEPLS